MKTRLDSDLQSFWEDYELSDLQGKSFQELKGSIEEYKVKKHWLDLEQARDEMQEGELEKHLEKKILKEKIK